MDRLNLKSVPLLARPSIRSSLPVGPPFTSGNSDGRVGTRPKGYPRRSRLQQGTVPRWVLRVDPRERVCGEGLRAPGREGAGSLQGWGPLRHPGRLEPGKEVRGPVGSQDERFSRARGKRVVEGLAWDTRSLRAWVVPPPSTPARSKLPTNRKLRVSSAPVGRGVSGVAQHAF